MNEHLLWELVKGQDEKRMCWEETVDIVCYIFFSFLTVKQDAVSENSKFKYKRNSNKSTAMTAHLKMIIFLKMPTTFANFLPPLPFFKAIHLK